MGVGEVINDIVKDTIAQNFLLYTHYVLALPLSSLRSRLLEILTGDLDQDHFKIKTSGLEQESNTLSIKGREVGR